MNGSAIAIEGLVKRVGWWTPQILLDGLDLEVAPGRIFGLLGPNGAGKTTTFKLLLGLMRPTAGRAFLLGREVPHPSSREGVGFLPEVVIHPEHLTVAEYLGFHARLRGLSRPAEKVAAVLQRLEMTAAPHRLLGQCSKGMRQRVDLARVLLGDIRLLFLDEPASGLDPLGQKMLKDLLLQLRQEGITILLSSHAVGILTEVCDEVGFLVRGRLVRQGRVADLLRSGATRLRFRVPTGAEAAWPTPPAGVLALPREGQQGWWRVLAPADVAPTVAALVRQGADILEVTPETTTLDEVFARVVGGVSEGSA
ncbi:MAG: ABC transporter, ATP-binding protein [Candidatus Ozemobacter sibiricus]|uniref:ABC transporter, ATP-binding protein n=1 Tax=Candidatus Ozemobacter sibiricus TaxID=2268124 RepID=A0A367ZTA2_9BACT|nr:MAG: ABC transporter, ATP-binding protein [Candidatus Ozemobacter sibiricus]